MSKKHFIYENLVEMYGEVWLERYPKILRCISNYIDSHSTVLQTKYMNHRLIYGKNDENAFWEATTVDKKEVTKIIKNCPNIPQVGGLISNPLYNTIMILSCFYETNNEELRKRSRMKDFEFGHYVRIYLGLRSYSEWQLRIFEYPFKDDIADYVLERLTNRHDIAKLNNIYEWIEARVSTNNANGKFDIKYISDVHIYDYIDYLHTRIKSSLKNIFREMKAAHAKGQRILIEDIQATNQDGKDFYTITSSVSNTIEAVTKRILQAFIQDQNIRMNLLEIACKRASSSKSKVERMLKAMRSSRDEKLMRLIIVNIVSYWIVSKKRTPESIKSKDFFNSCASAYSISHTNNPFIISLKETLDKILSLYSDDYIKGSQSTKNGYKQSVFTYILLYIMNQN